MVDKGCSDKETNPGPSQASRDEINVHPNYNNVEIDYIPTVLVVGGTGVGKSSLINAFLDLRTPSVTTKSVPMVSACFDRSSPQWGKEVGAPVSSGSGKSTKSYVTYGPTGQHRIRLIDSRGLEREGYSVGMNGVYDYVRRGSAGGLGVHRVDVVFVVTGTRWERGDVLLIQGLLEQHVMVIVVVAKADGFASLSLDESSPNSTQHKESQAAPDERVYRYGYDRTASAVKKDFANVPVFVTADVDNSLCTSQCAAGGKDRKNGRKRAPLQCVNGHGREWFVESRAHETWECTWCGSDEDTDNGAKSCNEAGKLSTQAYGISALRHAIENARCGLVRRGILQDQKDVVSRARVEVSREMEEVFWRAAMNSDEFSRTMYAQARKMVWFVAEQYVATRVISQALSTGLIDKECQSLAHRCRGPLGIFQGLTAEAESDGCSEYDTLTDGDAQSSKEETKSVEKAKRTGKASWVWSLMTKNVSAAFIGMSVQAVMMGSAFALEHVLFIESEVNKTDLNEEFAKVFSKFCKECEVDKMREVRARFKKGRTDVDTAICKRFEELTSEIVTKIRQCAWGQNGYK